jgi:two-component sensor histidine kinase
LQIKETIYVGLILNELITNSIKHSRPKGVGLKIAVTLRLDTVDVHKVRTRRLVIEVVDNGPGFSCEPLPSENETFGLSLVETIVEQYDGTLLIDRETQNGAKVSASLLLCPP